jgi:hypothetical protein
MKLNKHDKQEYWISIQIDGIGLFTYYSWGRLENGCSSPYTCYTWHGVCSFIAFIKAKYHGHDINIWSISGRFVGDDFTHLAQDIPAMRMANVGNSKHNRKIVTHDDGCSMRQNKTGAKG